MTKYLSTLIDGLEMIGSHAKKFSGDFFKTHLENAGFVDVKVHTFKVPYGHWAKNKQMKKIGAVAAEVIRTGCEAHGLALMTQVMKMPLEEVKKICDDAVQGMLGNKEHRYHLHWQIYGRKPE